MSAPTTPTTAPAAPVQPVEPVESVVTSRRRPRKAVVNDEATKPRETLCLLPSQVDHAHRLREILRTSRFAMDFSMLGAGKTFTASHLVLDAALGFRHLVVVAPVSVKPKWSDMQRRFGLPLVANISFCELRSVKLHQPAHGLLHRRDYQDHHENEHVEFTATDRFRQWVGEGVLLVMDEVQNIKNITAQFQAARALIEPIVTAADPACPSRVLLLSGSPIDRKEHALHLCRALHIMRAPQLATFNLQTYRRQWTGMQEIWDFCRALNAEVVDHDPRFRGRWGMYNGDFNDIRLTELVYTLFQAVIKPALASAMMPPSVPFQLVKRNAFYEVRDPEEHGLLAAAVHRLRKVTRFNEATGTVQLRDEAPAAARAGPTALHSHGAIEALRDITNALLSIETAKIGTLVRVAREALEALPTQKVVIAVNYTATLRDLCGALHEFQPLVLDGQASERQRDTRVRQFQAPTAEHRLLIGNVSVCSTGIDLDDKDGNWPRLALISPNYSAITQYQLGHRFQRLDTRSDAYIHFVFGAHAPELAVLDALARKSDIMKETTAEQVQYGVQFPGDYDRFEEPLLAAVSATSEAS